MHQRLNLPQETIYRMPMNRDPRETIQIKIPAAYKSLDVIGSCVESMLKKVDEIKDQAQLTYQIRLAAHEVCTNIINHAYAGLDGQIRLAFSVVDSPLRMVVDLWDDGAPFDPSTVSMPDLNRALTSGYGLFLIHQLMDEVIYESLPEQNHWQLVKKLS